MAKRAIGIIFLGLSGSFAWDGQYQVGTGSFKVSGYVCDGQTTVIYYPQGDGPFPIVAYLHGSEGELSGQEDALSRVASFGMTVVAPYTGGYSDACSSTTEWQDLVTVLDAVSTDPGLHSALQKVDWSHVGVWGQSMGAKTLGYGAEANAWNNYAVKAVLLGHGARKSSAFTAPVMFITSTLDDSSSTASTMKDEFNDYQGSFAVFANFKGQDHQEQISGIWGARFLACYVMEERNSCDKVQNICDQTKIPMAWCQTKGSGSDLVAV